MLFTERFFGNNKLFKMHDLLQRWRKNMRQKIKLIFTSNFLRRFISKTLNNWKTTLNDKLFNNRQIHLPIQDSETLVETFILWNVSSVSGHVTLIRKTFLHLISFAIWVNNNKSRHFKTYWVLKRIKFAWIFRQ